MDVLTRIVVPGGAQNVCLATDLVTPVSNHSGGRRALCTREEPSAMARERGPKPAGNYTGDISAPGGHAAAHLERLFPLELPPLRSPSRAGDRAPVSFVVRG